MAQYTQTWAFGNWADREDLTYVPSNAPNTIKGVTYYTTPYGQLSKASAASRDNTNIRRPYRIQEGDLVSYIQYDEDPSVIFKVVTV